MGDEDVYKPTNSKGVAASGGAGETLAASIGEASGAATVQRSAVPMAAGLIETLTAARQPDDAPGWLRRGDEIFALILKIVTVLALTFGLFEYDRQKADARVSESLKLVDQWESSGVRDAYTRINDLLWPLYSQNAAAVAALGDDPKARGLVYGNIGETVTGRDNAFVSAADRDVDRVFHFFERAALCADQSICDYPVLKTFFGSESESFWLYFSRYAERRQEAGYPGYGVWTKKFADGEIRPAKFLGWF
jgi:hypothetical protein